jgi:hypothetical protein
MTKTSLLGNATNFLNIRTRVVEIFISIIQEIFVKKAY